MKGKIESAKPLHKSLDCEREDSRLVVFCHSHHTLGGCLASWYVDIGACHQVS